ncbi:MAG: NAD(+) synthase [Candidatus Nanohaloarchaea archaeon]|nr:NAD(+) synthase [Candidatus Nanohaloarchaea archaeon]
MHEYREEISEEFRESYLEDPYSVLEPDEEECRRMVKVVKKFYKDHLDSSGMEGYVVGLSGGIDSSTIASLLVESVGSSNVYGVIMPAKHSRESDVEDAFRIAEKLGIDTNNPDRFRSRIEGIVDKLEELGHRTKNQEHQKIKRGNILARCRMITLRDIAKARKSLVAGTTNASERDLGYMTLAADGKGGIDNEALYNVYKTTEKDLSEFLGIPQRIIDKNPSADLWEDQTDKDELKFSYDVLDRVLSGIKIGIDRSEIAENVGEVSTDDVKGIEEMVKSASFKRELAPHPEF